MLGDCTIKAFLDIRRLVEEIFKQNIAYMCATRITLHAQVPALGLGVTTSDGHVHFFSLEP